MIWIFFTQHLHELDFIIHNSSLNSPYFNNFSNKPAPTIGSKLPLPSSFDKIQEDKPSLKRKMLENIDGGTLAKKLQF